MLENLLFSFNMCLPLFAVIALGSLLRHKGIFTEDFLDRCSSLVYNILLPANLFLDIAAIDLSHAFDPRYTSATLLCLALQFTLIWLAARFLCPVTSKQSGFIHSSFRGNFAYMGLPLLQSIYGTTAIASVTVVMSVVLPVYAVQGVVLMRIKERQGDIHPVGILLDLLRNPMILGILAGIPFSLFQIPLPLAVNKSLGLLQAACSPMALLVVGGSIQLTNLRDNFATICKACSLKLVAVPILWFAVALLFGVSAEQTVTMTLLAAMPSAVNSYVVTKRMGGDGNVSSGVVVFSHLLSLVSLTVVIFLLKTAQYI